MWLRDSLPHDLRRRGDDRSTARIMICGYESTIAESDSTQNLEDLANSFRAQVLQITGPSTARRIIFIAHSLGGLIVKQVNISNNPGHPKVFHRVLTYIIGLDIVTQIVK